MPGLLQTMLFVLIGASTTAVLVAQCARAAQIDKKDEANRRERC